MIDRTFEAVVFDWEIAGVSLRPAPVAALRRRVEALSAACIDVAVLSKSPVGAVDVRLRARPQGPGHLLVCGQQWCRALRDRTRRSMDRATARGRTGHGIGSAARPVRQLRRAGCWRWTGARRRRVRAVSRSRRQRSVAAAGARGCARSRGDGRSRAERCPWSAASGWRCGHAHAPARRAAPAPTPTSRTLR
jgi:hypothetical protein